MDDVSRAGRTVVFVSHNMATILNLCRTVVVMERGQLACVGAPTEAINRYMRQSDRQATAHESEVDLSEHANRRSGARPIFRKVRLLDGSGMPTENLLCGEPLSIELEVDPEGWNGDLHFGIGFDDSMGRRLFTVATYLTDSVPAAFSTARRLVCHVDELPLPPGRYFLSLNAGRFYGGATDDVIEHPLAFDVVAADYYGNGRHPDARRGTFLVRSRWDAHDE
jgi:lipopolysaccharide transport system ATP-binding protein